MKTLLFVLKSIHSGKRDLDIDYFSTETIDFSIRSGLGPYLNFCTKNTALQNTDLISADLTAKIVTHSQLQALKEITDIASPILDGITLLKGIATCQNFYPLPHFRIMADIDLLVSKNDQEVLEKVLLELGYQQSSTTAPEFYLTHHHSMPFYNKKNNIWIEVHTHLFSTSSAVINDPLFSIENIRSNSIAMDSNVYSRNIKCLCPELQLVHTCAHWAEDFSINKGAIQLIDMMLIIKNKGNGINWNQIILSINNTVSASYLYLLLSYLKTNELADLPEHIFKAIKLKNSNMAYLNRSILFLIINRFLHEGKPSRHYKNEHILEIIWYTLLNPSSSTFNFLKLPWNIMFPPDTKDRYQLSFLISRIINMTKKFNS